MDPCEKGSVDAAALLTAQERVDLTLTAQVGVYIHTGVGGALVGVCTCIFKITDFC